MKQYRTFKKYIRENTFWATITITIIAGFAGILPFLEGVPFMGWFMIAVLALTWIGSLVDWKKRG